MADLSIPGVNNQYEKLVEAIMKAERLPREKVATELEKYKEHLSFWQSLNQFSTQVKDVSRSFYSFNNPFNSSLNWSSPISVSPLTLNLAFTSFNRVVPLIIQCECFSEVAIFSSITSKIFDINNPPLKNYIKIKSHTKISMALAFFHS